MSFSYHNIYLLNKTAGRKELAAYFPSRKRSTRLRLRLTRQPLLRGGRRSPNSFFKLGSTELSEYLFFYFILTIFKCDENYFLETNTRRLGPTFQPPCKRPIKPRQQKKAVCASLQLFHLFTHRMKARHTSWSTS